MSESLVNLFSDTLIADDIEAVKVFFIISNYMLVCFKSLHGRVICLNLIKDMWGSMSNALAVIKLNKKNGILLFWQDLFC